MTFLILLVILVTSVRSLLIAPHYYHNPAALSGPTAPPIQLLPGTFPGVKRARLGVNHPPHVAPTLKKAYIYTSTHLWDFLTCYSAKFTF